MYFTRFYLLLQFIECKAITAQEIRTKQIGKEYRYPVAHGFKLFTLRMHPYLQVVATIQ